MIICIKIYVNNIKLLKKFKSFLIINDIILYIVLLFFYIQYINIIDYNAIIMAFRNIKFTNLLLQKQLFINEYNNILVKQYDINLKNLESYKRNNLTKKDEVFIENYCYNNMFNPSVYNKDILQYKEYIDILNDNIVINYKINIGRNILKDLR